MQFPLVVQQDGSEDSAKSWRGCKRSTCVSRQPSHGRRSAETDCPVLAGGGPSEHRSAAVPLHSAGRTARAGSRSTHDPAEQGCAL